MPAEFTDARRQYAAAALTGLLMRQSLDDSIDCPWLAEVSFSLADSMMAEEAKPIPDTVTPAFAEAHQREIERMTDGARERPGDYPNIAPVK